MGWWVCFKVTRRRWRHTILLNKAHALTFSLSVFLSSSLSLSIYIYIPLSLSLLLTHFHKHKHSQFSQESSLAWDCVLGRRCSWSRCLTFSNPTDSNSRAMPCLFFHFLLLSLSLSGSGAGVAVAKVGRVTALVACVCVRLCLRLCVCVCVEHFGEKRSSCCRALNACVLVVFFIPSSVFLSGLCPYLHVLCHFFILELSDFAYLLQQWN